MVPHDLASRLTTSVRESRGRSLYLQILLPHLRSGNRQWGLSPQPSHADVLRCCKGEEAAVSSGGGTRIGGEGVMTVEVSDCHGGHLKRSV